MNIVIGDIHGAGQELEKLIDMIVLEIGAGHRFIYAGDVIDRGIHGHLVWDLVRRYGADGVMGNHELKTIRWLRGKRDWIPPHYVWAINNLVAHGVSVVQYLDWAESLPLLREYTDDKGNPFVVAHAAVKLSAPTEKDTSINVYGNFQGEADENVKMPRPKKGESVHWWEFYQGDLPIFYGHLADAEDSDEYNLPRIRRHASGAINSVGLDTGAVHGGPLTAWCVELQKPFQYQSNTNWFHALNSDFDARGKPEPCPEVLDFIASQR